MDLFVWGIAFGLSCMGNLVLAPIRKTILRRPVRPQLGATDFICLCVVLATLALAMRAFLPPPDRSFAQALLGFSSIMVFWWLVKVPRLAGNGLPAGRRAIFELLVLPSVFIGPPLLVFTVINICLAPLGKWSSHLTVEMIRPIDWFLIAGCILGMGASVAIVSRLKRSTGESTVNP